MTVTVPEAYDTVEVRARYASFDGVPLNGEVTFTPSVQWVIVGGTVVVASLVKGKVTNGTLLNAAGTGPLRLYATDDPDANPTAWTYEVTESLGVQRGRTAYNISVPLAAAAVGVDLAAIAPGIAPGTPVASYVLLASHTALVGRVDALEQGGAGQPGPPGANAYELAVQLGYGGTLAEWLIDLEGEDGAPGLNANANVGFRVWDKVARTWPDRPPVPLHPDGIVFSLSPDDATADPPPSPGPYDVWRRRRAPMP